MSGRCRRALGAGARCAVRAAATQPSPPSPLSPPPASSSSSSSSSAQQLPRSSGACRAAATPFGLGVTTPPPPPRAQHGHAARVARRVTLLRCFGALTAAAAAAAASAPCNATQRTAAGTAAGFASGGNDDDDDDYDGVDEPPPVIRAYTGVRATHTAHALERSFLRRFAAESYRVAPASSIVPRGDGTLLFTNAGMVQFKDHFTGVSGAPHVRAASSQPCVRAGGKQSDVELVGLTPRHQTMFSMLGSFVFGERYRERSGDNDDADELESADSGGSGSRLNYAQKLLAMKRETISLAWRYLTDELAIDKRHVYVSVLAGDAETRDVWLSRTDVDPAHVFEMSERDNFWAMGDTGPCGPCTEIYVHQRARLAGDVDGDGDLDDDGSSIDHDALLEVWNLVFMQYERRAGDGGDGSGAAPAELAQLASPCVDTGMGLDRLAAVVERKESNFDTSLFASLIGATERAIHAHRVDNVDGARYVAGTPATLRQFGEHDFDTRPAYIWAQLRASDDKSEFFTASVRLIADHARTVAAMLRSGILPGATGRGYVLRKLVRRACKHAFQLGVRVPVLHLLVADADADADADAEQRLLAVLRDEEAGTMRRLEIGAAMMDEALARLTAGGSGSASDDAAAATALVCDMYTTHGLPVDFALELAAERGVGGVDERAVHAQLAAHRAEAADSWRSEGAAALTDAVRRRFDRVDVELHNTLGNTAQFSGYTSLHEADAKVLRWYLAAPSGDDDDDGDARFGGWLCIAPCPFYGEGGGQVGDTGTLRVEASRGKHDAFMLDVVDTQVGPNGALLVRVEGDGAGQYERVRDALAAGDGGADGCCRVEARVDAAARQRIAAHHSATHLLNSALASCLGADAAVQCGSHVSAERLRFDFTHGGALSVEQARDVERAVNALALAALERTTRVASLESAVAGGAKRLLGEAYADEVRVVRFGGSSSSGGGGGDDAAQSVELCGGTHVDSSLECYPFFVTAVSSVSASTCRIEAVAGHAASAVLLERAAELRDVRAFLRQQHGAVFETTVVAHASASGDAGGGGAGGGGVLAGVRMVSEQLHAARKESVRLKQRLLHGGEAVAVGTATGTAAAAAVAGGGGGATVRRCTVECAGGARQLDVMLRIVDASMLAGGGERSGGGGGGVEQLSKRELKRRQQQVRKMVFEYAGGLAAKERGTIVCCFVEDTLTVAYRRAAAAAGDGGAQETVAFDCGAFFRTALCKGGALAVKGGGSAEHAHGAFVAGSGCVLTPASGASGDGDGVPAGAMAAAAPAVVVDMDLVERHFVPLLAEFCRGVGGAAQQRE